VVLCFDSSFLGTVVDHIHDQPKTPVDEAALAQTLLAKGDLVHGAFHLAGALAEDPLNSNWLELLDRYTAAAPDPLELAPLKEGPEGNWVGIGALRALILGKIGRVPEAVAVLLQVIMARPDKPYLDWAIAWLEKEPAAGPRIDRSALLSFFGFVLQPYPGTVITDPAKQEELGRLCRFARQTIGDPDPEMMLTFARVALVRKLGLLDEALAEAERGYQKHGGFHLASSMAMIFDGRGDQESWLKWQRIALQHDPENVPLRLEFGDRYLDTGQFTEAVRWYEEALDREPEHPWALPSLFAARYLQGHVQWRAQLEAYAAAHPDNQRAASLVRRGIPYVGFLPEPQEATLGVLRQVAELAKSPNGPPRGGAKVTLSAVEAPSSRLACSLGIAALGLDLDIPFIISNIQTPDPRLPRRPVQYQVWKYREQKKLLMRKTLTTEPIAAVPEPPAVITAAVAEIARSPFDRPVWLEAAGALVRRLSPRVEDLLGIFAYPPDLPPNVYAPIWIQRAQVVAALALANYDPEAPWPTSRRKQVLFDLASGPMDWTVDAAIIALTALAQVEPAISPELIELFLELVRHQPCPGHVCYLRAAVHCFQQLPGLTREYREWAAEYQRQMESDR
jgi:tetratricopeptide (TPR) repeat protein